MKTLYLLRHAKSSRDEDGLDDQHRPLNKRGKRDCQLIARQLAQSGRMIPAVFCSPALRARDTLARIQAESEILKDAAIHIDDSLYTFDASALLAVLKELPQHLQQALVIGHNPALAEVADLLCDSKIGHIGTGTFMELSINVEYWDQLRGDCAKLAEILRPKQFR